MTFEAQFMNVLKPIFLLLLSISLTACQTQLVQQKKTIVLSQQQQANNVAINNFFEEVSNDLAFG